MTTRIESTDATDALYTAAARLGYSEAAGAGVVELERLRAASRVALLDVSPREGREIFAAAYEGGATAAANDRRVR